MQSKRQRNERKPKRSPLRWRRCSFENLESRTLLAGDITTGLVHHWTFDETTGDTAHDRAGTSDGTLLNWTPTEPKWQPGRVSGALRFSTADNAVIATPPAMSGTYAVSFWLNVTDRSGTNPRIFQSRAGNDIAINNDSSRSVGYYYFGNTTATADPSVPTFNTWEHYAINFNAAGQGIVYHNGAPVAVGGFVDSASLAAWVFGHSSDLANTTDSLNGLLDDLRVYSRLLTDADIALLASQGTPEPTHLAPVHHWTFDETSGSTAHDVAGGADGVLLNWGAAEPKWVAGKIGGALEFGTADNAVITVPTFLHAKWSVAFWVNVIGHGGTNPRVIGPQDGRELWAYLDLEHNGGGAFMSHNVRTFETTAIPLNTWEHYAINYDTYADTATIYHDGVQVATGVFHDNATLQAWVFGHNCDLGNHTDSLNGLLDDLRVYDRPLTLAEIQQLATVGPVVAASDAYTAREDTPLDVNAVDGLLANDSDLDDSAPKTFVDVGPLHGELTLAEDGSFRYVPFDDYNGSDSFTYRLTDSRGNNVVGTVALTVTPVNDAPSFFIGVTGLLADDEQPRVTQARNISFDGLSDHLGDGDPFMEYTEGEFRVTPTTGRWLIMTTNSPTPGVFGNPQPSIWEDTYTASLEVTRSAGGSFAFTSIDLFGGPITYTLIGLRGTQAAYSTTGVLPLGGSSGFVTIRSPSVETIDRLRIEIVRTNAESTNVDNIRLAVPVPSVSMAGWAKNITTGPPTATDEAAQTVAFTVTSDNPSLFIDQPAIDASGTLTFTAKPNVSGVAHVTVTLKDSGGTANGGVDSSSDTFGIAVFKPHPWRNAINRFDTTLDGHVVAGDVLEVVNYINAFGSGPVPPSPPLDGKYRDTTGDNRIAPDDAIAIINYLNAGPTSEVIAPAAATFVGTDATTQGNWQGTYGADGYELATGPASMPAYALISHGANFVWEASTTDPRALQKPGAPDRLAAAWYNNYGGFVIDVNLSDSQSHRVALFLLDWDGGGSRSEQIEVMDAKTNAVLDTQLSGPFNNGKYLVWTLSGHVQIRITSLSGNAVVSGMFFG